MNNISNYPNYPKVSFSAQEHKPPQGETAKNTSLNAEEYPLVDYLSCMADYNAVQINLSKPQLNVYNVDELSNNLNFAQNLLNEFNSEFPNLKSSTLSDTKLEHLVLEGAPESEIEKAKQEFYDTDKLYMQMHEEASKVKNSDYRIKCIKKYNIANCGDRAYIIKDRLDKMNCENKTVVVEGNDNYACHVFNVIGLDKNADLSNPGTWGKNAVVIDAWANKVMTPAQAVDFYNDFLMFSAKNQPMKFYDEKVAQEEYRKTHSSENDRV